MLSCQHCGFTTANFENMYKMLDLPEHHPERRRWMKNPEHRRTLEFYAWFVAGFDAARVLDIGSGPGTVAVPLARIPNVREVVCLDHDRVALDTLQSLARSEDGAKLCVVEADSPWQLPFPDNSFDVVVCRYAVSGKRGASSKGGGSPIH